jgi:hypothetical protein
MSEMTIKGWLLRSRFWAVIYRGAAETSEKEDASIYRMHQHWNS